MGSKEWHTRVTLREMELNVTLAEIGYRLESQLPEWLTARVSLFIIVVGIMLLWLGVVV